MELNWSTFVLEVINFLVLVWILKYFLYKPVLDVIARRRAGIEKTLADAGALNADASRLQRQYEGRLADWDQERRLAREELVRELEAERVLKMAELRTSLEQEREMERIAEENRRADATHKIEEKALLHGARFATSLLQQASGPDTEARLIELAINELTQLPAERIATLKKSYGKTPEAIVVVSTFEIPDDQRQRLERALTKVTSLNIPLQFEQDSDLMAGVRIIIGAWVLAINIQDELRGFAELAYGEKWIRDGDRHT